MSGIRRPAKLELGSDRIYEYGSPESSRLTHKLGVIDSNLIKQNDDGCYDLLSRYISNGCKHIAIIITNVHHMKQAKNYIGFSRRKYLNKDNDTKIIIRYISKESISETYVENDIEYRVIVVDMD